MTIFFSIDLLVLNNKYYWFLDSNEKMHIVDLQFHR